MSLLLKPDWAKSALITIDMQNDFCLPGAVSQVQGSFEVIPNIASLLAFYRECRRPVVHVVRLYLEDGSNADLCRKEAIRDGRGIVAPGTPGAELVDGLREHAAPPLEPKTLLSGHFQPLGPYEWAMFKPRWGAFYQTNLESFLRERDIDTIVFCGCNFPNCPRTSIYEASERDFKTVLVSDAVSGVYDRGLQELAGIGVNLIRTEALLEMNAPGIGKDE